MAIGTDVNRTRSARKSVELLSRSLSESSIPPVSKFAVCAFARIIATALHDLGAYGTNNAHSSIDRSRVSDDPRDANY